MNRNRKTTYWQSLEEREGHAPAAPPEDQGTSAVGRREFLKLAGFSVGAATVAGCTPGTEKGVIPYLIRPEEITPGRAYWYASVCGACSAGCGILAKNRDGRPIKLEGNPDHPLSRGGLCATGQASVLSLYDSQRLRHPLKADQKTTWPAVDEEIIRHLQSVRSGSGRVRFLTDSVTGPAEREQIEAFLSRFPDGRLVTYDPLSQSAIARAHEATHGSPVVPRYRFDRAEVIVSLAADFLGTWLSPVEFTAGYKAGRNTDQAGRKFSRHIQLESRMTLTGSNADQRIAVPPGSAPLILAHLAQELCRLRGSRPPWKRLPACPMDPEQVKSLAGELWDAHRGRTLVVCGENNVTAQKLAGYVNHLLGNEGMTGDETTIDLEGVSFQLRGNDRELRTLLDEMRSGGVDALFIRGVNPVYDLPAGEELAQQLQQIGLVVSFSDAGNETSRHADYVCPEPHFLESWGDSEPVSGLASLRQPVIRPMGQTRPLLESLSTWMGRPATALELLRESWRRRNNQRRTSMDSFDSFWNRVLHDGQVRLLPAAGNRPTRPFQVAAVSAPVKWAPPAAGEWSLELHPSHALLDGRHAHNAWLQELPDPIAKTVWDNFVAISPSAAGGLGIRSGDVVRIQSETPAPGGLELPALIQPGQHDQVIAVSLGYGRQGTERFTDIGPSWFEGRPTVEPGQTVGQNAAPLLTWDLHERRYNGRRVRMEKTGRRHELATTQIHHSLAVPDQLAATAGESRPIIQEATLAQWQADPSAGGHAHHPDASLYPDHPKSPHHWGLAIDLSACTGCSACVVSCQAENNIPVVGKDEVSRAREMHWLRIDRYYSGEGSDVDVAHMPMMCQHCDNAPCENVCPVQATAQSAEGLNQQIYNRCVGTRYCANNCPYKVRRFNWFDYPRKDQLQNLALNPDVTVRSRGVMEKCSLCVQRIQDAKAEAKRAGRNVQDGEIQPACVQSCPAGAMVFGDMNDPASSVTSRKQDPRHFTVLPELGVKPIVGYLTLIRNRNEETEDSHS